MRAALLPTPGEPFMLSYWLRNYRTWASEVDELRVLINGGDETARMMVSDAGGIYRAYSRPIGHGPALRDLIEDTEADQVVLCEDDAYVRTPDTLGWAFTLDAIVGSPRYEDTVDRYEDWSTAQPISQALWPAFLFARRDDLLATDRDFGDRRFALGEMVPGIGPVTPEMCEYVGVAPDHIHLDTFYATTYQLRHKRIELVHRTRVWQAEAAEEWIKHDPPWFHVSGLSAIGLVLAGQWDNLPDAHDWPRRISWWERTYREADASLRDSSYGRRYRAAMDSFRERAGIDGSLVDAWDARFEAWA